MSFFLDKVDNLNFEIMYLKYLRFLKLKKYCYECTINFKINSYQAVHVDNLDAYQVTGADYIHMSFYPSLYRYLNDLP